ncbi:hypothetical protein AB4865_01795 [Capnocytophaga sp. ARDL2]|uniref:hypothetical protein n=1 Tax=Capnocytophaga sp. ARDL2 TaxID=3238809 RepID=UPI003555CB00
MNLNKLNITELNVQEVLEVEGGRKFLKEIAIFVLEKCLENVHLFASPNNERFVLGHAGGGRP